MAWEHFLIDQIGNLMSLTKTYKNTKESPRQKGKKGEKTGFESTNNERQYTKTSLKKENTKSWEKKLKYQNLQNKIN